MEIRVNRGMRKKPRDSSNHSYEKSSLESCQPLIQNPLDLLQKYPGTPPYDKYTRGTKFDTDL